MRVTPPTQEIKKSKISLIVLLIILTVICGLSVPQLLAYYSTHDQGNWKAVAAYLEIKSQPNDIIIVEPAFTERNFLYYYTNFKNNPVYSVGKLSLTELENLCRKNRVWFVYAYIHRERFDENGEIWNWLCHHDIYEERKSFEGIYLFFLPTEGREAWLKVGIFRDSKDQSKYLSWTHTIISMGASISIFNETAVISSVDISEFDVVVFVAFKRPLNKLERLHIEESIQNGLSVAVSGISPYYLAGGTNNLTRISSWFGATNFSEAPKEARWKVKFTENVKSVMTDLDLDREYEFYKDFDWSTPYGCIVEPESVIYAYSVGDGSAVIFSHKFGKGTSIFIGPRYGFGSPDAEIFIAFLQALIRSLKAP